MSEDTPQYGFIDDQVIFTDGEGISYLWTDFIEAAKGNLPYAKKLLVRAVYSSPFTVADEDLREGEIVEINNQYVMIDQNEEHLKKLCEER